MGMQSISYQVKKNMKLMYPALYLTGTICFSFDAVSATAKAESNPIYSSDFTQKPADAFELASNGWLRIRLHAENSLRLPNTENKMRSIFLIPQSVDFTPYQALLDSYKIIHDSADDWNRKVYPEIIKHAHAIRNYAGMRILYSKPITQSLSQFLNSNSNSDRQKAIAFLSSLKQLTKINIDEAYQSVEHLNQFYVTINEQIENLNLLEDTYMQHTENDQQELVAHLIESRELLEELCADYHQHVIDSATRVQYKKVPLLGFIPFPSALMQASDEAEQSPQSQNPEQLSQSERAKQLKQHIKELQQNINNTANEIKYKKNIAISYKNTLLSLLKVSKHIEEALNKFELIHTDWQGLLADLDNSITLLQNSQNNTQLKRHYEQFKLEQTSQMWGKTKIKASQFTKNALLNNNSSFIAGSSSNRPN